LGDDGARRFNIMAHDCAFSRPLRTEGTGGWRLCPIPTLRAGEVSKMTDCADLDFRKAATGVGGDRTERRMKMVRAFMMAAIASMVVLALIAEARMTP
jgi:hypothetical protein